MKGSSPIEPAYRRVLAAAAAAAVVLAGSAVQAREQTATAPANVASTDAVQDFQRRLQAYLDLRAALAKKIPALSPTASPAELDARQRTLADALRKARAGARPGDLIPAQIALQIRAAVVDDFRRRGAADERATFSEVPDAPVPAINRTYPADAALPTVPPLLLVALPRLPDNLQYRFYGRHVVLLDGDLQIIADYIANVLPPH